MSYSDPLLSHYGTDVDVKKTTGLGSSTTSGLTSSSSSASSSSFLSLIDPILGVANTVLSGIEQLGADALSKSLTAGELSLEIEENTRNVATMKDYLANDFESAADQSRTELDKQYQDIYDSLMSSWGGQSAGYAAAGQEAVAGGSAQAVMGKTRENVEYYFGEDLQKDSAGGLFALATTNLENDIANSREEIENAIETGERSNENLKDAQTINNMTWLEKLDYGIRQSVRDVNKTLGLSSGTAEYDQSYKYADLIT
jgi:hypothetical protein